LGRRLRGVTMAVAPARPSSSATVQPSRQPLMIGRNPKRWARRAISSRSVRSSALKRGRTSPRRIRRDLASMPFFDGSFSSLFDFTSFSHVR